MKRRKRGLRRRRRRRIDTNAYTFKKEDDKECLGLYKRKNIFTKKKSW